ncbi:hypothetical protein [Clostridium butyricum]
MNYIKTSISREKLYDRNYTRDTLYKVEYSEETERTYEDIYKALTDILTIKHLECINN